MKKKYSKRKNYKTKRNKKRKTKRKQRGGVCPCAIPLSTTVASSIAGVLGIGVYSLNKKKNSKRKKPKK